jgi:hypothetical protein
VERFAVFSYADGAEVCCVSWDTGTTIILTRQINKDFADSICRELNTVLERVAEV